MAPYSSCGYNNETVYGATALHILYTDINKTYHFLSFFLDVIFIYQTVTQTVTCRGHLIYDSNYNKTLVVMLA